MPDTVMDARTPPAAVETHLLGQIDFGACLRLQERLVRQVSEWGVTGQIHLLICEHPEIITVGRGGSPAEIQLNSALLRSRRIEVRWVKRGGGCLVHAPGQLAVYPIVSLQSWGLSVGEYLDRLQAGILNALEEIGFRGSTRTGRHGIWGRTGQLVTLGVAVRDWVAYHGAFINVCPSMGLFRMVQSDPEELTPASCLLAERRGPAKMTSVRAALVHHLSEAFGCKRYHLYTGHPLLRHRQETSEVAPRSDKM